MAKNGKMSAEERAIERAKEAQAEVRKANQELANKQEEVKKKNREVREAQKQKERIEATQDQVMALVKPHGSKLYQVGVNAGSTITAQGLNELINLGVRALAEWGEKSKKKDGKEPKESFWYSNVDLFQSTGGAVGLIFYILEMATRPKHAEDKDGKILTDAKGNAIPYVPSLGRQYINELALILQNLGLHNLFRTLRFRFREDVDEKQITEASLAAARAEIEELRKQIGANQGEKSE